MSTTIHLTHPETGALYEAQSEDQAQAMGRLGWVLAKRSEVEDAAEMAVLAEQEAYEAAHLSGSHAEVFADDNPTGLVVDAPAADSEPVSDPEPPARPPFFTPQTSGDTADDTDSEA